MGILWLSYGKTIRLELESIWLNLDYTLRAGEAVSRLHREFKDAKEGVKIAEKCTGTCIYEKKVVILQPICARALLMCALKDT